MYERRPCESEGDANSAYDQVFGFFVEFCYAESLRSALGNPEVLENRPSGLISPPPSFVTLLRRFWCNAEIARRAGILSGG